MQVGMVMRMAVVVVAVRRRIGRRGLERRKNK